MRAVILALAALLIGAVWVRDGAAQAYEGGVRGTVQDSTGVIPDAAVALIDEATNVRRAATTNAAGQYTFVNVSPGRYSISTEVEGFKPYRRSPVDIGVQTFLIIDITLEIGGVTEQITVTAESPILEKATASIGTSIEEAELESLPTFARNPWFLSVTTPGVMQVGPPLYQRSLDQNNNARLSLAGGPVRGNNYTLDGVPITDLQNRAVIIPSIESVEEMRVQVSTYDAEMGRTGGGVFNVLHKRGGNMVHGSALLQNRPGWGQAREFFTKRSGEPRPDASYWLYASSLGGPIVRDKTFFWTSIEGAREDVASGVQKTLPTPDQVRGDFSRTGRTIYDPLTTRPDPDNPNGYIRDPFPGNVIPPERIDPVGQALAELLGRTGSGTVNLSGVGGANTFQTSINVNHQFDTRNSLSGTYMLFDSEEFSPQFLDIGAADWDAFAIERQVHVLALNHTWIPDNDTVVQFRYGYTSFTDDYRPQELDVAALGFSSNFLEQTGGRHLSDIDVSGYYPMGPGGPDDSRYYSHAVNGTVSRFVGTHTLKLGGSFRRLGVVSLDFFRGVGTFDFSPDFTQGPNPLDPERGTGDALASLLLGFPAQGSIEVPTANDFFVNYLSGFVQDDWRVSPNLVLNLGVRLEHETGLQEVNNAFTVGFDRESAWPVQPVEGMTLRGGLIYAGVDGNPTEQGDPTALKVGPRAGLSWSIDQRTVVRGGYGLFWSPPLLGGVNPEDYGTIGFTGLTSYLASTDGGLTPAGSITDPFPNGAAQPVGSDLGLLTNAGRDVSFVDQFAKSAYVQQFSVGLQRELPWQLAVTVSYLASRGSRLSVGGAVNINQLDPSYQALGGALLEKVANPFFGNPLFGSLSESETVTRNQLLRPYPQFLDIWAERVSEGRSRYHAVSLKLQRRFQGSFSANANYTWSRLKDDVFGYSGYFNGTKSGALDAYDLDAEFGPSSVDAPHRFNLSALVELPFGTGKRWLDGSGAWTAIFGNWSVSVVGLVQSGFPLRVFQVSNNTGLFTEIQRPDVVPGVDPVLGNDPEDDLQYVNPNAWELAEPFTFGDSPRTDSKVRSRARNNWDLALAKSIEMGAVRASLRLEWINLFNRPEFVTPVPAFGIPVFGRLDSTNGSIPRTFQIMVRFDW